MLHYRDSYEIIYIPMQYKITIIVYATFLKKNLQYKWGKLVFYMSEVTGSSNNQ